VAGGLTHGAYTFQVLVEMEIEMTINVNGFCCASALIIKGRIAAIVQRQGKTRRVNSTEIAIGAADSEGSACGQAKD